MRSWDTKLPMAWKENSNLHINFHFSDNSVWITFISLQKGKRNLLGIPKTQTSELFFFFFSVHHPTSFIVSSSSSLPTTETRETNPPPQFLPSPAFFPLPSRQKGKTQNQINAATGEFESWVSDEKMKWWSVHSEEGLQWHSLFRAGAINTSW